MLGSARRRRRREGATPLQAAIAVSLAGFVLAAFVPTYVRNLRLSKVAESATELNRMHSGAAAYFATPWTPEGRAAGAPPLEHCLPLGAGPTPEVPSEEPVEIDFADPDLPGSETWRGLAFVPDGPVRFRYSFVPVEPGCDLRSPEGTYLVTLRAEGDLDGDGARSLFERRARANAERDLVPTGILYVRDRSE